MKRIAVLALAALPYVPCHGEELGRLFFTPAERAALDEQRRAVTVSAAVSRVPEPLRLDGYVLRADGRTTVWVNGEAAGGESLRRKGVKVGATLDGATGETRDLIGAGQVRVQR